jgi:hypothetical protein
MTIVEPLRVLAVELVHPEREIGVRGFDQEVIVVGKEAVAVAPPGETRCDCLQDAQEEDAIPIVHEDVLPSIAAGGYVVEAVLYKKSGATRHRIRVPTYSELATRVPELLAKTAAFRDMSGQAPTCPVRTGARLQSGAGGRRLVCRLRRGHEPVGHH